MAVKHVTLRAWSDNSDVAPVKINQGDILSRTIIMTLLDSTGAPIDLTLSSARVHFSKPDGTVAYLTASIVNATAGIISVTLDSQCTAVPGLVKSIVQVTGPDGENLFFVGLNFQVAAVNIEDSIVSSNEFTALTDALKQVQGIANKVDKSTTINGHSLEESFSLTSSDIGAIDNALKGVANGIATLNSNGKVIQDPASYGQANGGATLDADGKVIQDPASYGKAGGATLNPNKLPTEATIMALINGTLTPAEFEVFAPGVKTYSASVNKNGITGSEYCIQFPSGTLIYAGLLDGLTVSTSETAGSLYVNSADLNYTVSSSFPSMTAYYYSKVNAKSTSYLLVTCNDRFYPASKQVACTIMSSLKTTNTPYAMSYLVLGRWK
jgi:hypothetical protein